MPDLIDPTPAALPGLEETGLGGHARGPHRFAHGMRGLLFLGALAAVIALTVCIVEFTPWFGDPAPLWPAAH